MCRCCMDPERHEADEEVLPSVPCSVSWHRNTNEAVWCEADARALINAMLEMNLDLTVQPRQGEEDSGGDEIVPATK